MKNYSTARSKLSDGQKAAMDTEYQAMRQKGKLAFTSKITGLDYTIPENAKRPAAKPGTKTTSASSFKPKFTNGLIENLVRPRSTEKIDLTPPKGSKPPTKPAATSERLETLQGVYNSGRAKDEVDGMVKLRSSDRKSSVDNYAGKDSYLPTVPTLARSSAAARYISQEGNILASKALSKVDKKFGTNLDGRELFGQSTTERDMSPALKSLLYKMAYGKYKSTGENKGTFLYDDMKGHISEEEFDKLMVAKSPNLGLIEKGILSLGSTAIDYALTIGGGGYERDPITGNIKVTDSYDFINEKNVAEDGKTTKKGWTGNAHLDNDGEQFIKLHNRFSDYDLGRGLRIC